jgi:hypothetical protein
MAALDLLERLRTLPDQRMPKKTLHRLDEMVFVAICAVVSGARAGATSSSSLMRSKLG